MEDLADMRAELGATFLYATSDPLEASVMADDLVVMDAGRVVDAGPAERVYRRPAHLRAAELVGFPRCNVLPGRVRDGVCETALFRLPVALDAAADEVSVVIRAEDLAPAEGAASRTGEVRLLENLGAESVVHFGVGGDTLVTTAPSAQVADLDIGDPFPFVLRPQGALLYARGSGALVGHGAGQEVAELAPGGPRA